MGLLLKDRLELLTPLGSQEIQLLFGDITKLPLEEKVDIIFVSAFHGSKCRPLVETKVFDPPVLHILPEGRERITEYPNIGEKKGSYTPVKSTLIGSLNRNLGIVVKDLARHKELDLWKHFSCWVSAQLPASVPFRRVVCFEYNQRIGTLVEQLSQMFRAMMPVFNNTESTVITPLLGTGNQGHSGVVVLSAMINGACHWIQAGLPLHCLKIVVFSENPDKLSQMDKEYMKQFAQLKAKWCLKANKAEKISKPYDICLSFSPADKELAEVVTASLLRQAADARIHSMPFEFNHGLVWQTDIFSVMKQSRKIIILLTPAYLDDTECIEQFNIALCCNRLKKAEVVIPFHMNTVGTFPSYMSMVQYVECSLSGDEEATTAVIESACSDVVKSLKIPSAVPDDDTGQVGLETLTLSRGTTYDIFISYSHRHGTEPGELAHVLRTEYPHLNVFLDLKELKAGNIWQQAVYEAADKARCVVAFLTPGYLASSVCNEEFNIALARHYAHDSILLVPVVTDTLKSVPRRLTSIPCADLGHKPGDIVKFAARIVELVTENKSRCEDDDDDMYTYFLDDPFVRTTLRGISVGRIGTRRKEYVSMHYVSCECEDDDDDMYTYFLDDPFVRTTLRGISVGRIGTRRKEYVSMHYVSCETPNVALFKEMMAHKRGVSFINKFYLAGNQVVKKTQERFRDTLEGDIVISYAQDCLKLAAILSVILKKRSPKLDCHLKGASHSRQRRQHLDTADIVIYFVSDQFVSTQSLVEELHTGLCRQRTVKDSTIVYFIQCNHMLPTPFYLQALPFSVSMDDSLWKTLEDPLVKHKHSYRVDIPGMEGTYSCNDAQSYALSVAAHDVLHLLSERGMGSQIPHNIVNIIQAENALDGIDDDEVSAQEIVIPIASIHHVIPKQHTPRELPKLEGSLNLQQQASIGEITSSHYQKTLDNSDTSTLRQPPKDEMRQPQPPDDQTKEKAAGESSSGQLKKPDGSAGSRDRGYPDATAQGLGPQTTILRQGSGTTRQDGKRMGSQDQNKKQKVRDRSCCIL